jgi:hypothetical protein
MRHVRTLHHDPCRGSRAPRCEIALFFRVVTAPPCHVRATTRIAGGTHTKRNTRFDDTLEGMTDDDKTTALLTEIRDLLLKQQAHAKEQREWVLGRIVVPAYALLVILILVELIRR